MLTLPAALKVTVQENLPDEKWGYHRHRYGETPAPALIDDDDNGTGRQDHRDLKEFQLFHRSNLHAPRSDVMNRQKGKEIELPAILNL